jgi:hypothetical protein
MQAQYRRTADAEKHRNKRQHETEMQAQHRKTTNAQNQRHRRKELNDCIPDRRIADAKNREQDDMMKQAQSVNYEFQDDVKDNNVGDKLVEGLKQLWKSLLNMKL